MTVGTIVGEYPQYNQQVIKELSVGQLFISEKELDNKDLIDVYYRWNPEGYNNDIDLIFELARLELSRDELDNKLVSYMEHIIEANPLFFSK